MVTGFRQRGVGRVERLSKRLDKMQERCSRLDPRCTCYPKELKPYVEFPILEEFAFFVKCVVHGDPFQIEDLGLFIYRSKWLREKMYLQILNRSPSWWDFGHLPTSVYEQWRKATLNAFPDDLWPIVEEQEPDEDGPAIFFRLKDGTRIKVFQNYYAAPSSQTQRGEESWIARRKRRFGEDLTWKAESLRSLAELLIARKRWVVIGNQPTGQQDNLS